MRLWRTQGLEKTSEFLSVGLDAFLLVACGVLALTAATARDVLVVFASSKYAGVNALIPLIISGLLIYTTHVFFAAGLLIHKKTRVMAVLLVVSAVLNLALNCLLLPRMGLQAAALATLLSYIFCLALLARASFKILPLKIDVPALLRYGIAAAAAWFAGSHVSFALPIVSLAARASATICVYVGLLYIMDARLRMMCRYTIRKLWPRTPFATFMARECEAVSSAEAR
jgi:O-antigen/teichoic acid export membrane protein